MLLARAGLDVALVDRASFPGSIMSTHYIHPEGMARLAGWGLLDGLRSASDAPRVEAIDITLGSRSLTLDFATAYPREFPTHFAYSPRRAVLDTFLVNAARAAGVTVHEGFSVRGIIRDAAGRVTGVSGTKDHAVEELSARLVVGADGMHSQVARLVGAEPFDVRPSSGCFYYSYFRGMDPRCEFALKSGFATVSFPVANGLHCVGAGTTLDRFSEYRADVESTFLEIVAATAPAFSRRLTRATRVERWIGTADLPQFARPAWGPGWALVGDAGLLVDPTRGFGITKAFTEAEWLAEAVVAGMRDGQLDAALARYGRARDRAGAVFTERNQPFAGLVAGHVPASALELDREPLPLGSLEQWAA